MGALGHQRFTLQRFAEEAVNRAAALRIAQEIAAARRSEAAEAPSSVAGRPSGGRRLRNGALQASGAIVTFGGIEESEGGKISLLHPRENAGPAALPVEGRLPGFDGATGWLNSAPLRTADLRGKVVLVDF
jgi:hypothetical protein